MGYLESDREEKGLKKHLTRRSVNPKHQPWDIERFMRQLIISLCTAIHVCIKVILVFESDQTGILALAMIVHRQ
jgi:hypothetical protein